MLKWLKHRRKSDRVLRGTWEKKEWAGRLSEKREVVCEVGELCEGEITTCFATCPFGVVQSRVAFPGGEKFGSCKQRLEFRCDALVGVGLRAHSGGCLAANSANTPRPTSKLTTRQEEDEARAERELGLIAGSSQLFDGVLVSPPLQTLSLYL